MKPLRLFAVLMLVSGCATQAKFEAATQSWVGSKINDYIATSGHTPNQVLPDDNGGQMYMFGGSSTGYVSSSYGTANAYGNAYGAHATATGFGMMMPVTRGCTWVYRVDRDGVIWQMSYHGNACKQK
jgi:hypothetical protein